VHFELREFLTMRLDRAGQRQQSILPRGWCPAQARVVQRIAEIADAHPAYHDAFVFAAIAPTPLWLSALFLFIPSLTVNALAMAIALVFYFWRNKNICTLDEVKRRRNEIINTITLTLIAGILGYVFFLYVVVHYAGVWLDLWT